jgi:protein TonB
MAGAHAVRLTPEHRHSNPLVLLLACGMSLVGALTVAYVMYFLISTSEMELAASERIQMLDFVRVKRSEAVERKSRKPERPQLDSAPEAPPTPAESSASDAGQQLAVTAPPVQSNPGIERTGLGAGSGDGEYLPIVKVAPVYPRRALQKGLTGTCLVTYSVTTAGTVRDVSVVDGQCTDPVFERPSIEAARRFRYKPRVIDGSAVEVHGIYNMFHFEKLEEQAQ